MNARKLIVTAVGLLLAMMAGTAVADDGLVFLIEGETNFSLGHEGVCASAGVDGYSPFQVVDELLSPQHGGVEGTVTICGNFRKLYVQGDERGEEYFSGRYHDTGEMVFELDSKTIRVPYVGIDAAAVDLETGSFFIEPTLRVNGYTETIVAVESPGPHVPSLMAVSEPSYRLFYAGFLEGFATPIFRGSVVLVELDVRPRLYKGYSLP